LDVKGGPISAKGGEIGVMLFLNGSGFQRSMSGNGRSFGGSAQLALAILTGEGRKVKPLPQEISGEGEA